MDLSRQLRLAFLLLALGWTAGCDQVSKHFARSELGEHGFITMPGGFGEFRLAENPGAFLSLGDSLPNSLRLGLFTIAVGIGLFSLLAYLVFAKRSSWPCFVGIGLVWAGGTSNLIDRILQHGLVSDFILIRVGPLHTGIFNVADVVIMTGCVVFACDLWWQRARSVPRQ